ncbi:MAG: tRNA(Ile)-lysidine synthase [Bacteroidota bacterium]|jgi:tRNA(Ile)-lysidine synthase
MLNQFQHHISQQLPFLQTKKLIIAVSGGIDSMVLLELCQQLDWNIAVAHCNFSLRGLESDEDEIFVRDYCQERKIPFYLNRFNTAEFAEEIGMSIQMTARQLRYDWFETLRVREGYDYIVTAHQADDVAETFLINLTRGTGWDGLTGIPQQNGVVVRPLLPFSRKEIENYAAEYLISWREDSSNAENYYQRNALRHEVIPVLKDMNPVFLANFQKTLLYLQDTKNLADWAVAQFLEKALRQHGNEFHLDLHQLNAMPAPRAILYYWLKNYGFTAWEDIYHLPQAESGKQIFAPDFVLLKNRTHLILYARHEVRQEVFTIEKNTFSVNFPIKLEFCSTSDISTDDANTIFVDADLLDYPLTLRKWIEGDMFHPFGMDGTKKLSKYFKDEKYSLTDKERQWLLCSGNKIVWVIGKRADNRFKITNNTQTKLKITFTE